MGFWFFGKKKEQEQKPLECSHKWKDFPWYMKGVHYSNNSCEIEIYEPYVCIKCKKRKDILLYEFNRQNISWKEFEKLYDETEERYKDHIQLRAVVEDQIHDFQMIDKAYLEAFEKWQAMK